MCVEFLELYTWSLVYMLVYITSRIFDEMIMYEEFN